MRTIFLDTVGLIALWNRNDQWHAGAVAGFQSLSLQDVRLVTTPLVLVECANTAARRAYKQELVQFRHNLIAAGDLLEPTPAEVEHAWVDYESGSSGTAGVVDLVSFAVMRRLNVAEAFTNDQHFAAAGFRVLF